MITKHDAERIAAAIHAYRPEWPAGQVYTLCGELMAWPVLDLFVGLAYVAVDPASKSPYRVKERGPWRTIGTANPEAAEAAAKAARDRDERLAAIKARNLAIRRCDMCDDQGYIGAIVCDHETEQAATARRGAARARAALAAALKPEEA